WVVTIAPVCASGSDRSASHSRGRAAPAVLICKPGRRGPPRLSAVWAMLTAAVCLKHPRRTLPASLEGAIMNPRKLLFTALACLACAPVVADSMRSASLADAGLTLKDFPRWQMLAPGVHVYEGLHSPVDGVDFNTVSLIVVGDEGVVLVDGQGD